jgi:hypothetical protein
MSLDFAKFVKDYRISISELERMKHRLYVVGKFNGAIVAPDQPPQVFLFTDRPKQDLPEQYVNLFTKKFPLKYSSFIQALRPSISEREQDIIGSRLKAIIQDLPAAGDPNLKSIPIDELNYFFQRAVLHTSQAAFKGEAAAGVRELLGQGKENSGKSIYKQIRKHLKIFNEFQSRSSELADVFSKILDGAATANFLPPYASGAALPGGFFEKLIDFLYDPDLAREFSLDGLDLTAGAWSKLAPDTPAARNFKKVVNTYRNALVDAGDQHPEMTGRGGRPIFQLAKEHLAKKNQLAEQFRAARDSYNSLNQIVRSKVLLSMVMQWIFLAHEDLDAVRRLEDADQVDKDEKIADLILDKSGKGDPDVTGVAKPVRRASLVARRRFRQELTDNFEKVVLAVVADDGATSEANVEKDHFAQLVQTLRGDNDLRATLRRLAPVGESAENAKVFIEAQKSIILDVLVPVLEQTPILSLFGVRTIFRRELKKAYLTAVMQGDDYQQAVQDVAEDFLPTYEGNIDRQKRSIRNSEAMQAQLLRKYIERIANPDIAERIEEALRELDFVTGILQNTIVKPGETRGASHVTPIFNEKVGVTIKTKESARHLEALVQAGVNMAMKAPTAAAGGPDTAGHQAQERETEAAPKKNVHAASAARAGAVGPLSGAASSGGKAKSSSAGASVTGTSGATRLTPEVTSKRSGSTSGGSVAQSGSPGTPQAGDGEATASSRVAGAGFGEESDDKTWSDNAEPLEQDLAEVIAAFSNASTLKTPREQEEGIRQAIRNHEKLTKKARSAVRAYHQILGLIFERYRENRDKPEFIGNVDRMSLANVLLSNQEVLDLGSRTSNLYAMLLDAVQGMDPDDPDPSEFIRKHSLTKYVNDEDLAQDENNQGIAALRQIFEFQTRDSMRNVASFISELRGMKYLLDNVSGTGLAEVVVVNATATEFLSWIASDNLGSEPANAMLQSRYLESAGNNPPASPGLIYMTDASFDGEDEGGRAGSKKAWLQQLSKMSLQNGNLRLVVPPICLSTGPKTPNSSWDTDGRELAGIASEADGLPAPVVIVGPSPDINPPGDAFPTYLPAGYLFAAHFLARPHQRVANLSVVPTDFGRFRVVGAGIGAMTATLDRILLGGSQASDDYAFAADYWLHVLLTVFVTAENQHVHAGAAPNAKAFFDLFVGRDLEGERERMFDAAAKTLEPALLGSGRHFALSLRSTSGKIASPSDIESVIYKITPQKRDSERRTLACPHWFQAALSKTGVL